MSEEKYVIKGSRMNTGTSVGYVKSVGIKTQKVVYTPKKSEAKVYKNFDTACNEIDTLMYLTGGVIVFEIV